MSAVRLEHWYVMDRAGAYAPCDPATAARPILTGIATGHPQHDSGKRLYTGRIRQVEGKLARTARSTYELGEPHPEFTKLIPGHTAAEPLGTFKGIGF